MLGTRNITSDEARAKLNALSALIESARIANEAKPSQPEDLLNRSARKSLSATWKNTEAAYEATVDALDDVEKSPIAKMLVALVFLITATAVLFDLNDRSTQLEVMAWDLLTKSEPGTPQRTRATNLIADAGASLDSVNLGLTVKNADLGEHIQILKELGPIELGPLRLDLNAPTIHTELSAYCPTERGRMTGVDFSERWFWRTLPPKIENKKVSIQNTRFDCLFIQGEFTKVVANSAYFISAILESTSFANSLLLDARFDGASLYNVSFEGADVTQVSFENAYLTDTSFKKADLVGASFEGSIIGKVDFTNADLRGVNFSGAQFVQTNVLTSLENLAPGSLTQEQLDHAWAWDDDPPIGLEDFNPTLKIGKLCKRSTAFLQNLPKKKYLRKIFYFKGTPIGC